MNERIKMMWIKALKSGNYTQNYKPFMRDENGYDPFGVLTELFHAETGLGEWYRSYEDMSYRFQYLPDGEAVYTSASNHACLPIKAVRDWAGLQSMSGNITGGIELVISGRTDNYDSLVQMHDKHCSFEVIADVIAEYL